MNEAVSFSVKAIETAVAPLEEVTAEEVTRLEVSAPCQDNLNMESFFVHVYACVQALLHVFV